MEEISSILPCREEQIQELLDLLGEADEPVPHSIFISGNTATGKTACVTNVLQYLGYKHVIINCVECYTTKILYETIAEELSGDSENLEVRIKCDSLRDLIQTLNSFKTKENPFEPYVIVLDKAERLRNMDQTILAAFFRLRELCDLNICVILLTDLIYENFYYKIWLREPIQMYFPNYSKEELFKIIFLSQKQLTNHVLKNHNVDVETKNALSQPEVFANFLNAFLSVFYRPCRDLIELKYMAKLNFMKYCEPIIEGDIKANDLNKLWKHISPILKDNLEMLYLRVNTKFSNVTSTSSPGKENSVETQNAAADTEKTSSKTLVEELISTKSIAQSFELPYYTKYLLIAAYLASYNPPKEDKRLFLKNHGKQRKRLQQVRAKAKISEKLNTQLGPKTFPLDRFLAIFYAILEEKIGLTSNLMSQITALVDLKLLALGSKELDLDCPTYKCVVSYDFIAAIAQTVGFNIRKYLYDFI